ncbi:unnamed protein product [Diamesa tonsa]
MIKAEQSNEAKNVPEKEVEEQFLSQTFKVRSGQNYNVFTRVQKRNSDAIYNCLLCKEYNLKGLCSLTNNAQTIKHQIKSSPFPSSAEQVDCEKNSNIQYFDLEAKSSISSIGSEKRQLDVINKKYKEYQEFPDKHPLYKDEWAKYWNLQYYHVGTKYSKENPNWHSYWLKRLVIFKEEEIAKEMRELRWKLNIQSNSQVNNSSVSQQSTTQSYEPFQVADYENYYRRSNKSPQRQYFWDPRDSRYQQNSGYQYAKKNKTKVKSAEVAFHPIPTHQ